jgi:hypothetical protein
VSEADLSAFSKELVARLRRRNYEKTKALQVAASIPPATDAEVEAA